MFTCFMFGSVDLMAISNFGSAPAKAAAAARGANGTPRSRCVGPAVFAARPRLAEHQRRLRSGGAASQNATPDPVSRRGRCFVAAALPRRTTRPRPETPVFAVSSRPRLSRRRRWLSCGCQLLR